MSTKEWRLLFHWPLPLAVVAIATFGAVVSPTFHLDRLLITYSLIFFGLVCAAYAFDAMYADWRPMIQHISSETLVLIAFIGGAGFIAIAAYAILTTSILGIVVALLLMFFVVAYNLEIPKWIHNKWGFAISWGGLTAVASYFYQSLQINWIMIPLFVTGFTIALQEWYNTNTHSFLQQDITLLKPYTMGDAELFRRDMRRQTFKVTSLMCYSLLLISMTVLMWRLL